MGIRNISLQPQGQTGGNELGPGNPGTDVGPRAEGWRGGVERYTLEVMPSMSRLWTTELSCEVEKCFCASPNFKRLCSW